AEARSRYSLTDVAISHRTGRLLPGEVSVAIAVSSPHRNEAFEAGRWLIDTLKARVPVWKQEQFSDGRTEWIHPDGQTSVECQQHAE
ncbi:MAG: molybdenum cofactor biosynthesis protein MoaE, partial [Planctomyces sp.]